uniref:Zinc finger protein 233-like n=1 Tax=Diabrotica virgifera virgifera TaxID=50390 RepID=A0A6P7G1U4_DIAVI
MKLSVIKWKYHKKLVGETCDQHGNKTNPFEENQEIEKDDLQENMDIMEALNERSSHEENDMNPHAEGTTYNNMKDVDKHLRTHIGKKTHKCEICFKQFSQTGNLKIHLRRHTGEKPHKCEICFTQFSESGKLKRHLRVHTGTKPHKCEICFKQFIQTGNLKIHLRRHTGEKPHKCEICFTQFSESGKKR